MLLLFEDGFRQFFAREETYPLFGRHLDGLTIAWVDSLTSSALAYFEGAKAHQAYFIATLERITDRIQRGF